MTSPQSIRYFYLFLLIIAILFGVHTCINELDANESYNRTYAETPYGQLLVFLPPQVPTNTFQKSQKVWENEQFMALQDKDDNATYYLILFKTMPHVKALVRITSSERLFWFYHNGKPYPVSQEAFEELMGLPAPCFRPRLDPISWVYLNSVESPIIRLYVDGAVLKCAVPDELMAFIVGDSEIPDNVEDFRDYPSQVVVYSDRTLHMFYFVLNEQFHQNIFMHFYRMVYDHSDKPLFLAYYKFGNIKAWIYQKGEPCELDKGQMEALEDYFASIKPLEGGELEILERERKRLRI